MEGRSVKKRVLGYEGFADRVVGTHALGDVAVRYDASGPIPVHGRDQGRGEYRSDGLAGGLPVSSVRRDRRGRVYYMLR